MQLSTLIVCTDTPTTSAGVSMSLYTRSLHKGVALRYHGHHCSRFASDVRAEVEETVEHGAFGWYL